MAARVRGVHARRGAGILKAMQSKAATATEYIASLPEDRKVAIEAVRKVVLANLGKGYSEGMTYGMIGYFVPHSVYPAGYHCDPKQPLPFAGLASQKNYMSLHMMSVYCGCDGGGETEFLRWFREAWTKTGKKLDMGKACIRFKRLEDLSLEVIGEAIRRVPVEVYISNYELMLGAAKGGRAATSGKVAGAAEKVVKKATKPAAKKVTKKVVAKAAAGLSIAENAKGAKRAPAVKKQGGELRK